MNVLTLQLLLSIVDFQPPPNINSNINSKEVEQTPAPQSTTLSADPNPDIPLLSEVMGRFARHQSVSNAWNNRTLEGYLAVFETLKEIIGDIPIDSMSYELAEHIRDILLQLPPNRMRSPQWRNLSIAAILKKKPKQTMSPKTSAS